MVGLLSFSNGELFAIGAIQYLYQPATFGETTPRILLRVIVEGIPVIAIVDTGAPYVLCSPLVARRLRIDRTFALGTERILIRGVWITGRLHRMHLQFRAEEGDNLDIDVTAFVPDPEWEEGWDDLPFFIGLSGCLERMRFAFDPNNDMFYFGPV